MNHIKIATLAKLTKFSHASIFSSLAALRDFVQQILEIMKGFAFVILF